MFNDYTGAQYTQYISLITRHVIQFKTTNKAFVAVSYTHLTLPTILRV